MKIKINRNFYLVPWLYMIARTNPALEELRKLMIKRWNYDPFASHVLADNPMVDNKPVRVYYAFEWLWFSIGIPEFL